MSKYVKVCIARCNISNFRSLASRWLYRALDAVKEQFSPDFRVIIQVTLESAPIEDMDIEGTAADVDDITTVVEEVDLASI